MIDKLKDVKPQFAFLIIGLVYGLCFLIITPPFQVPDEPAHFYKAFYLSEGHVIPEKTDIANGFYLPQSVVSLTNSFHDLNSNPGNNKQKKGLINTFLAVHLKNDNKVAVNISNIAVYPPAPYLAPSAVVNVGKLFDLSPLFLMYICRLINLLIWVLLIYLAIKITPIHKWVFLLLSLMPMTLYQAASISADSLTIALSFLIIAMFLKFSFDENKKIINLKDNIIIFALILILALSKSGYFVLLLLFLMIPESKFKSKKTKNLIFISIFLILMVILGLWGILFNNLYSASMNPNVVPSNQLSFILSHPLQFIHVLGNTILMNYKVYMVSFVGTFGWFTVPLSNWMVYPYLIVLVIISIMDKINIKINLKQKFISLIPLIIICISLFIFEYITWTPVGQNFVGGIQGRYFIPVAPLFFLLFYNSVSNFRVSNHVINFKIGKKINWVIIIFIIVFLSLTIFKLLFTYYI